MANTMKQDALTTLEVSKNGEASNEVTVSNWIKFDLLDVLTPEEVSALGRKAIEMKANNTQRKAIKSAIGNMTLSDATELAVFMLKKTAEDYATKKRIDDAIDTFEMTVPQLLHKNANLVKLAETGIAEAVASFKSTSDALEALDKWYGPASVKTSDKTNILNCYQRAVGLIGTFFGTKSPLK